MSRQKLPVEVVIARGKKHLTQSEIAERMATELRPVTDNITAPEYLTKKQKTEFNKYADQLKRLGIIGETDTDALARFVIANDMYVHAVKQMRKSSVKYDPVLFGAWSDLQNRYFKQCREAAGDLGLTITSRCKLVVPSAQEPPKVNKFAKFEKG